MNGTGLGSEVLRDIEKARATNGNADRVMRETSYSRGAVAEIVQETYSSGNGATSAGDAGKPDWPKLDDAAYHGPAGEYVRAVEPHTEADPVAVLGQFLALAGNVLGRRVYFEVEADRHHGNLFVATVGETAKGRKGTSLGVARRPFGLAFEDFGRRFASGLSSGEGLIWAVRDPIFKVAHDAKTGQMVDAGVEDKRLIAVEQELASPLAVMKRDGNNLSPIIRQAWDGDDLRTLTKNSPAVATGAHVSLIGHVTADELKRELGEADAANGFANRWLWLLVRRSKCLPRGGKIAEVDIAPTVRALRDMDAYAERAGLLDLDGAADALWTSVYPELTEGRPGMAGAMVARAEAQAMRLALIYAALDRARAIQAQHLRAGIAVVQYVTECVQRMFGTATGNPEADKILSALRSVPDGLSVEQLYDLFQRHISKDRLEVALATLAEAKLASFEAVMTGGRPKVIWRATA